jgi:uncharacterized protein (UPF0305 family)
MAHIHDSPSYKHTVEDLMEHEIDTFMTNLLNMSLAQFLDTTFTEIKHCEKCDMLETSDTKRALDAMNETVETMKKNLEVIKQFMVARVSTLYPQVVKNHPEVAEAQDGTSASHDHHDTPNTE